MNINTQTHDHFLSSFASTVEFTLFTFLFHIFLQTGNKIRGRGSEKSYILLAMTSMSQRGREENNALKLLLKIESMLKHNTKQVSKKD